MSEQRFQGVTWTVDDKSSDPSLEAFRQLEKAEALRLRGELDRAQTLCEPLVARHPDYYGALYTLGLIYADKGQAPQALGCLVRAVMLNPRSWKALTALSGVYLDLGAHEMAAQSLEQARQINPQDAAIFATLAEIYVAENEFELAYDAYRDAIALDPGLVAAAIGLGICCMQLGRNAEAATIFQDLIQRGNRSLATLAPLSRVPPSLVQVDLAGELAKVTRPKEMSQAQFENSVALIKAAALDKQGRAHEAWPLFVAANRAIFLARQDEARQVSEMQRASLAALKGRRINVAGAEAKILSLFILGPSRAGKTTMEALVGAIPGVKRGYENPIVKNAIRRAFQFAGLLTDKAFEQLPSKFDALCRDIYLEELGRRGGKARVLTNTNPVRIHDAARMAAAFPGARFIFVKRTLDDNMLRIFMRDYAVGNPYAYDLKSIREHLLWYHQMIDTLAGKLLGISRVVAYEDVIADPAAALKMAAELCGLEPAPGPPPALGDDRGCAEPYRDMMEAALHS